MPICERCQKEHDGSYGSGRFCSVSCANKRDWSPESNKKRSDKLTGRTISDDRSCWIIDEHGVRRMSPEFKNKWTSSIRKTLWEKKKDQYVKLYDGDGSKTVILDITYEDLEKYEKEHTVCEICGKSETKKLNPGQKKRNKLCRDHDHNSNHFRGLLCNNCNGRLGWFENNRETIENYLKK